jgi:hypothetical protein
VRLAAYAGYFKRNSCRGGRNEELCASSLIPIPRIFRVRAASARRADGSVAADNAPIVALARHAAMAGATTSACFKNVGQVAAWLVFCAALACGVGQRLWRWGVVGKGRGREKQKENHTGKSFHGVLLKRG